MGLGGSHPWLQQAQPHLQRWQAQASSILSPHWARYQPFFEDQTAWVDSQLAQYRPWQLVLVTVLASFVLYSCLSTFASLVSSIQDAGVKATFFRWLKKIPGVQYFVDKELGKYQKKIRDGFKKAAEARLREKAKGDVQIAEQDSLVSGTLYMAGKEHQDLLNEVYASYAHTNPLHTDVFPSLRTLEAEVIAMTASLVGGGASGNPEVCGAMTSGGSESILTAVKASRDYMAEKKGIKHPEMIIAVSAHAAFFKAAEYFKVKLVVVPVGKDHRMSASSVKRAITRNTILVVASSPGFPHGVMDPVEDIAKVTRRYGVCLHSDACLGGFVLPFARKLGHPIPPFDFSVPGVTSMSIDTHKFGMAHKGTSVVLYSSRDIRKHQFTQITEWSGGLYISPGFAGSRSGALIATAWASLVHMGEEGYLRVTQEMLAAAKKFQRGVANIQGLRVVGQPEMCVVAFESTHRSVDIYKVNDLMTQRGWHLNALQFPAAVHICFTARHVNVVDQLLKDLQECTERVRKDPKCVKDGMAPMYGMAAVMPDRRMIGDFLTMYQEELMTVSV
ncbi:hypothetical protein WJX74_007398 [Apatococcus lobatus]|uniref:sphinganine-1-phosphate aldolase n=1 Tax=Apatococcus lobatus TaxID=904363 RepID=A0AAW1QM91_9CHLO